MRILFVLPQIPYPPESGGRIVTWNMLRRFADKHECWVTCLYHHPGELSALPVVREQVREIAAFRAGPRLSPWRFLRSLLENKPYKAVRFRNAKMAAYIQEIIRRERIEVIHAQNFYAAQYVTGHEPCLRVHYKENIEGLVMARYAEIAGPPWSWTLPLEAWRTLNFERRLLSRFHHILSISNIETEVLQHWSTGPQITYCPPGVDLEAHPLLPIAYKNGAAGLNVLFAGTMSYPPNDRAARWLLDEIWPLVYPVCQRATLSIVGHGPRPWLLERNGKQGVEVTGSVPDMRPYYEKAAVVVLPLQIGGGVKLKLLEAMAFGRPVVSTPIGAEGLDLKRGREIEIAESAVDFAKRIVELLKDVERREQFVNNARKMLERDHNWDQLVTAQIANYEQWLKDAELPAGS